MKINFTKAVASGNDFVIVDNRAGKLAGEIADFGDFAKFVCRRMLSVGSDGLLVLEDSSAADFKMRIFNPDGSEVTMCGNGIRCSALYAYEKKWCGAVMKIETGAGTLAAEVEGDSVKVKMTAPKNIKLDQNIGAGKTIMNVHTVNTGVPHVVHFVEKIEKYPVKEMGSKIRYHKVFQPEGTNANFVQKIDDSTIVVRTYERGVEDETLACGTGVVASAIISHLALGAKEPVSAITRSKEILRVSFKKEHKSFRDVFLEGQARIAFEGEVDYV
ncbi:MAG: diaminopimelate epimerase [Candidatus Omnitrophica bacterium]|nr:diaminopimelate epimerase [Candidatus Omnitrophota bacterium]